VAVVAAIDLAPGQMAEVVVVVLVAERPVLLMVSPAR
jgi:hypothetical protein